MTAPKIVVDLEFRPQGEGAAAMERYDLADLVQVIGSTWSGDRVKAYAPSYPQQTKLETWMRPALKTLIWIATEHGWGEEALDEYRARYGNADATSQRDELP